MMKLFWKTVYLNRAEIVRRDPFTRYEKVIELNLKDIISSGESKNIKLQNFDRFVVHSNLNFFERENVQILGEVNIPGSYPLLSDDEPLSSILKRAGLTSKALENGISIFRDKSKYFDKGLINKNQPELSNINTADGLELNSSKVRVAWDDESISLMPGDSVVVKEKTSTVMITGAVYNPGIVRYKRGKSLRYYINASGGLTDEANKAGIIVLYSNGIVSPKKWYSNPKVIEGSTIIVNKKQIEEEFDLTQFATNWTSIISSMVTAVVLAKQLEAAN